MFKQESIIQRIIGLITTNGAASEQDVAEKLGISIEEATEKLRMLVAIGYLQQDKKPEAADDDVKALKARIDQLESALSMASKALNAANGLLQEFIEQDEEGPFMVSVDGAAAPRVEHVTEQEARTEAERIAGVANRDKKTIRVLKVIDVLNVETMTMTTKSQMWQSQADEMEEAIAGLCDGNCEGRPNA